MSIEVKIKETGSVHELDLVSVKNGFRQHSYIHDFIGNTGVFAGTEFEWDEDNNVFLVDQDTFDWWKKVIEDHQELEYRIDFLHQEHGIEAVLKVLDNQDIHDAELEDTAKVTNAVLDEAFGIDVDNDTRINLSR